MTAFIQKLFPTSLMPAVCLALVAMIVAIMPVHAFISTWGGTAIGPLELWKSWKEIVLVGVFAVVMGWIAISRERRGKFVRDHFVWLVALYALITLIDAAVHIYDNGIMATAVGVAMNLRFVLIALLSYCVFAYSDVSYVRWRHIAAQFLVVVGVAVSVLGIVQVSVLPHDFLTRFGYEKGVTIAPFTLLDDNPDALRAFATLRGPNDFGAFLILPITLSIIAARRNKWMGVTTGVITLALIASGSRSAWLGALAAIATLVLLWLGKKALRSPKVWLGAGIGFIVGLVLFIASLSIPAVRLAVFHSSPGDSSLTEGSTDAHWQATSNGVRRVIDQPLGCGPGCSGPASYYGDAPQISENYFVQIAEEIGVVGLAVFVALIALVARRLYRLRSDWFALALLVAGVGLSAIGVWLHVWSDDPLSLTYWALVGMVLGTYARKQTGADRNNLVS